MNVLITSVGNKTNLIKYFRRALFNECGGRIIGADCSPLNNAWHFVDEFFTCPEIDDQRFEPWLFKLINEQEIDLIIPSRDGDLRVLSQLKNEVSDRFSCRIVVSDEDALDICLNKEKFYSWCVEHDFKVAEKFEKGQVERQLLPLFIKPKEGSGSANALKVATWEQWLSVSKAIDGTFIIQRFISSPEYTVDVFSDDLGRVKTVVPRARLLTFAGESIHGKVELDEYIIADVTRLSEKLRLQGHNTVQCFKTLDGILMSEVNARYGGGFTLSVEAGADSPRFLIQEKLNKSLTADQTKVNANLQMIRIQKDIFIASDNSELSESNRKIYCFDLDGTICTEHCSYELAKPVSHVVERIRQLYAQGHEIIIATARGAASGTCWRSLVEKQLSDWQVPFHHLVLNKPYADFYIDNKSVDILEFL